MKKTSFSESFKTRQSKVVEPNATETIFYGEIPAGSTGFLGVLASNDYEGVLWSWYIDDECVEENIDHELGNMKDIEILQPPYVVTKHIEVKAKNTLQIPVTLEVYCNGVCYQPDAAVLVPMPTPTMVLQEIRDEMRSKNPEGEVTDRLVNVTSTVQDVYDEALQGLFWTTCSAINSGPNNVYIAVNDWVQPEAPLPPGESMNIDFGKRGSIKKIWLKCDNGETAQVRLHAMK
jgi:hypothetical protein